MVVDKPRFAGLTPGFSSKSDETLGRDPSLYDLSCWWDVKLKQTNKTIALSILFSEALSQAVVSPALAYLETRYCAPTSSPSYKTLCSTQNAQLKMLN